MRFPVVILLSLLFCPSLTRSASVEERKANEVVKILNKVLKDVAELTTKNITIPRLDFGDFGWFENVTVGIPRMTNSTDGVGAFGFKLDVNVSDIFTTGYYNVKDVNIPGLFPLFGKGNFDVFVKAANLKLKVTATRNFATDKFDFSINIFTVEVVESKVHFENLMGDPHVSDFLNELLGNLTPSLLQSLQEPLLKILDVLVDYYGNGVVDCLRTRLDDLDNCLRELFETVVDDILCQFGPHLRRLTSAFLFVPAVARTLRTFTGQSAMAVDEAFLGNVV